MLILNDYVYCASQAKSSGQPRRTGLGRPLTTFDGRHSEGKCQARSAFPLITSLPSPRTRWEHHLMSKCRTGFLGSETFLDSLIHIQMLGKHAPVPTSTLGDSRKVSLFSGSHLQKTKSKTRKWEQSNFPWPHSNLSMEQKLHISEKGLCSQARLPELQPLLSWS